MNETENIKKKLDYWGIKRQWLADRIGVNKATLSLWLNGSSPIPDERLRQIKEEIGKLPEPE